METKKQSKNFLLLYVIKKLKNGHFGSAARQSPEDVICRVIGSQYLQIAKYLLVGQEAYQRTGTLLQHRGAPLKNSYRDFVSLFAMNTVPVKGHWGRWGPWSKCSRTCGQGYKTRSRQCDDPTPLYGGQFCSGTLVQLKPCQLKKTCK